MLLLETSNPGKKKSKHISKDFTANLINDPPKMFGRQIHVPDYVKSVVMIRMHFKFFVIIELLWKIIQHNVLFKDRKYHDFCDMIKD